MYASTLTLLHSSQGMKRGGKKCAKLMNNECVPKCDRESHLNSRGER